MKKYQSEIQELKMLFPMLVGQKTLAEELSHLLDADKDVVLLLYSRRSLEVLVRDICLKEEIKISDTIPLKGIIDKLNKEKKVPSNIITAMLHLNGSSVYGAHPKEFDSGQVRTALINLASILKWFVDYKGIEPTAQAEKISQTQPKDDTLRRTSGNKAEKSIVVLPFANMSSDPEQEYFCDGISEEIINSLTHISELKVIARTSAFSFKDQNVDVREIGRKLDVNYLLEGSVRKGGNKLRITAQLINLIDGIHLYSERFDRELDDIFEIQDEITAAIVDKLKLKLLGAEKESVYKHNTDNSELYNLYLLARYHAYQTTPEDIEKAFAYIEKMKELDDKYAPCYLMEGFIYQNIGGGGLAQVPPKDGIPKSNKAFLKAIELNPDFAYPHACISYNYLFYYRDKSKTKYHIEKALHLDPNNSEVLRYYAFYLRFAEGAERAIKYLMKSIELDPLGAFSYQNASGHFCWNRQYDKALQYCEKGLEINPRFLVINWFMGIAYYHMGNQEKAIELWEEVDYFPHFIDGILGYAYAKSGQTKKLEAVIERWKKRKAEYIASDLEMAYISMGLGETEKVFNYLNSAMDEKPTSTLLIPHASLDPVWDPIRNEAEFQQILAKIWKGI